MFRALQLLILVAALVTAFVGGCGDDKSPGPDTRPPAAVTDLTLLRTTETTATLTWTAPGDESDKGGAASYDLRYSLSAFPAGWDSATVVEGLAIPRQGGLAETTTVIDLRRDRVYYLALRTLDDAGNESDLSNIVQAQTADPTPPSQVTDLRVARTEMRAVTLGFTAPGDDGNLGTATAYEVRYGAEAVTEATWEASTAFPVTQAPQPAGTEETMRVDGLTPGASLHFALRARDDAGQKGPISNDVAAKLIRDEAPPVEITDLVVSGTGLHTATLTWTAPADEEGTGRAAAYAIRYALAAIKWETWNVATPVPVTLTPKEAGGREEVTLTELPGGQNLWFAVRAADGLGNWSDVSNPAKGFVWRLPRTWVVKVDGSGDAASIQGAIQGAMTGDTVLVEPGRYYENLDYLGKDLLVRSTAGPQETILDGSRQVKSCVIFQSGETRAAVLEGFTVTGGRVSTNDGGYDMGGGVFILDSEPSIIGNIIRGNSAVYVDAIRETGWGGGIAGYATYEATRKRTPLILGNEIRDNVAGSNGGGIAGFHYVTPEIVDNVIVGNSTIWGDGGGVWIHGPAVECRIVGNVVTDNVAGDHGGGMYIGSTARRPTTGEVSHNLVARNLAHVLSLFPPGGGGLWIAEAEPWVHHNTFVDNSSEGSDSTWGGGIGIEHLVSPVIENNIIAWSPVGGAIRCDDGATPVLRDNLVWMNGGGEGTISCGNWLEGNGNIYSDPLFCNRAAGVYSLAANSPALTHPHGPLGYLGTAGCGPIPPP